VVSALLFKREDDVIRWIA